MTNSSVQPAGLVYILIILCIHTLTHSFKLAMKTLVLYDWGKIIGLLKGKVMDFPAKLSTN